MKFEETYKCTNNEIQEIKEFARQVQVKRAKRDRRNRDTGPHRILREITGKIGEVAVAKYYGGVVDFNLWEDGTFGHEPDLNDNQFIKTCSTQESEKYGYSWLFDNRDPIVTKPTENQIVIFTSADPHLFECKIFGHVQATQLAGRFGPARTLAHKCAVWLEDYDKYKGIKDLLQPCLLVEPK